MLDLSSNAEMTRLKIIIIPAIIGFLLCLAFAFQGRRGIWQPDEGYYVGTAVTMLEKQSLLIPFLGEKEYSSTNRP